MTLPEPSVATLAFLNRPKVQSTLGGSESLSISSLVSELLEDKDFTELLSQLDAPQYLRMTEHTRFLIRQRAKTLNDVITRSLALENASLIASELGHPWVEPVHLLLALVRSSEVVRDHVESCGIPYGMLLQYARDFVHDMSDEPAPPETRVDTSPADTSQPLDLLIDPGSATAEELAELFSELSKLYHMLGGSGITFKTVDTREPVVAT